MRVLYITFFLFSTCLFSQTKSNVYLPSDLNKMEAYLERINNNHINRIEGEFSSKIKKVFKDRDEKIFKIIEDSGYVFNSTITKNVDAILKNIYQANPEINTTDYQFFIKNSIVPNAGCYGDGMFEINLGLFTTLESDDELAFVICHEIAHKLLDHSLKRVSNSISTINSKETKKKVKAIKRKRYGQTRAALSVIDELSLDILDHSKEAEAEADSLGFVLFSKTNYNKTQSISSLKKLDLVDDMVFSYDAKIDSVFNFESYPFKSYWLKKTTSLFDTDEKINEFELSSDTVKTHPEIAYRVNKLIKDFNISTSLSNGIISNMKDIINEAHFQSIQYTIDLNFLDLAVYQLIQKHNEGLITSDFYYVTMAEVLKQIYSAKKDHELGKYVPPSNDFSNEKQLNIIRLFLRNLEMNEVNKIGLIFCETNKNNIKTNQAFNKAHNFFKNN